MTEEIGLKEIAILVGEGLRVAATVKEEPEGYIILAHRGSKPPAVVVSTRRQVRHFKRIDTAAAFLRGIGIKRFDCDLLPEKECLAVSA